MNANYKSKMDTRTIANSFVGVIIGILSSFALLILGTICLENEYLDMTNAEPVVYVVNCISMYLSILLAMTITKTKDLYLTIIVPVAISIIYSVISIFSFDGLNGTTPVKVLVMFLGAISAFFTKKALQGTRKQRKRKIRSR